MRIKFFPAAEQELIEAAVDYELKKLASSLSGLVAQQAAEAKPPMKFLGKSAARMLVWSF